MIKKVLSFFLFFVTISFASAVSASSDQELRDLAIRMVTPSSGNPMDATFRKNVEISDAQITKQFNSLTDEEKEKVMELVRNNGKTPTEKTSSSLVPKASCYYQSFPYWNTFQNVNTTSHVLGSYSQVITNDPSGNESVCDYEVVFENINWVTGYVW